MARQHYACWKVKREALCCLPMSCFWTGYARNASVHQAIARAVRRAARAIEGAVIIRRTTNAAQQQLFVLHEGTSVSILHAPATGTTSAALARSPGGQRPERRGQRRVENLLQTMSDERSQTKEAAA